MMNDSGGRPAAAPNPAPALSLRSFLLSPFDPATWRAALAILIGLFLLGVGFNGIFIIWSIGGGLLVILVGIPIIGVGIELARYIARAERWRMEIVDGRPMTAHPYRPLDFSPRAPYDDWLKQYAEGQFLDVSRWRDVVYVLIGFPLAILEFVLMVAMWAIVLGLFIATVTLLTGSVVEGEAIPSVAPVITGAMGLALVPIAAFVTRGLMMVHRAIAQTLLCVDPTEALRQDVERLRESRSAAVELEASELRRIERDLHDGAQQRLVMLAMDLGRAEEKIATDPAAARKLVADAREQSRLALAELRDLVRGTAPSILIDRGLVAAVASIAGQSLSRRSSTAGVSPISASARLSNGPATSSRARPSPTWPSTAAPSAATSSSGAMRPRSTSRSGTTATVAPALRMAAGWPACVIASPPSTARSAS